MTKISLTDLANLQNEATAVIAINTNGAVIEAAFENTLSRDGTDPNTMQANLDMNSNHIINLPTPISNFDAVRLVDITSLGSGGSITVNPLPVGGTINQVLTKNSSTNFDTSWVTPSDIVSAGTSGQIAYYATTGSTISGTNTLPAITLGGTVAGAGKQINNVIIGTTTPLAGFFTSLSATTTGFNKGLDVAQAITGSSGGNYQANRFRITSDNAATSGGILTNVIISDTFGGSTIDGGRQGLQIRNIMSSATNATNSFPVYTAATFVMEAHANDNGTGLAAKGHAITLNTSAITTAAATFWDSVQSIQADVFTPASSSMAYRAGVTVTDEGSAVQGTTWDTAFGVSALASSVGFKNAILIGDMRGFQPMSSTATLIATTGTVAVAKGIDFASATFTGNQYTGPGATISNVGYAQFTSGVGLVGGVSGEVFVNVADAAGSYNFNLPIVQATAVGQPLISGVSTSFGTSPMTWGAITGTGSFVLSTSPTFVTGLTVPLVIGGTGVGSVLTLESTSGVGSTDSIKFKTGSQSDRMQITTSGLVHIGASVTPLSRFTVNSNTAAPSAATTVPTAQFLGADSTSTTLVLDSYGTGTNPFIVTRSARGTGASFTATQSGDALGFFGMVGATAANTFGNSTVGGGGIWFGGTATETWTATAQGSRIDFYTTTNTTASINKRMQLAEGLSVNTATDPGAGNIQSTGGYLAYGATAVPAGGTTGSGLKFSSTSNLGVFFGSGVPTLSAAQGSLYVRTDGSSTSTRLYVNTNGTTGWTNVTTAT